MQSPDHSERQRPLAVEHFTDAVAAADIRDEIPGFQSLVLHVAPDGLDRVRKVDRVMLRLPRFDQGHERVNPAVLAMRADKPYVNDAAGVVDPHHDAVFVARDVEHGLAVLMKGKPRDIAHQDEISVDAIFISSNPFPYREDF